MDYQTGDILLFKSDCWYSQLIEYFGYSDYSHVAMILKDPTYINPEFKGLYIIESGYETFCDAEDNKHKFGVQINKLETVLEKDNNIYYRKLILKDENIRKSFDHILKNAHDHVHNKPYDVNVYDWLNAKLCLDEHSYEKRENDDNARRTDRYWCSALVAYLYSKMGLLDDAPWSLVAPKEFSEENMGLLKFNCELGKTQFIEPKTDCKI